MNSALLMRAAAVALLAAAARPAAAQQFQFAGVPWGAPADSVRARLEASGYRHVRTYENGDLRFRSDADVVVLAGLSSGRLVNLVEERPAAEGAPEARFAAATDSLKRVYGAPAGTRPLGAFWQRGFTFLEVYMEGPRGDAPPALRFWYRGPGGDHESMTRLGQADPFAPLDSTWVVVGRREDARLSLEAGSIERRPDGSYRARVRMDHSRVQPDPSGPFDAIVYGYDVDCAGRRLQMRSRAVFAKGRPVRSDRGATIWVPVRSGSPQAGLLDAVCAYMNRQ